MGQKNSQNKQTEKGGGQVGRRTASRNARQGPPGSATGSSIGPILNKERTAKDDEDDVHKGKEDEVADSFQTVNDLRCVYTNADSVVNKMDELRSRVTNLDPHIIDITETKPRHAHFNLSLPALQIKGYKIFHNSLDIRDDTCGCALFVKSNINTQEVDITSDHKDCIWVSINMLGKDSLLVGCVCRSPKSTTKQNQALQELIVRASYLKHSHLLIMGAFNHPNIN